VIGYGLSGNIGGLPRKVYYTPDGKVIRGIPQIREYAKKDKDGKIIETGTRDANLDHGWLLSPPTVLKISCIACSSWHDTKTEVRTCKAKQEQFIRQATVKAKSETVDRTSELEKQVAELKAQLDKLMEVKSGPFLQ